MLSSLRERCLHSGMTAPHHWCLKYFHWALKHPLNVHPFWTCFLQGKMLLRNLQKYVSFFSHWSFPGSAKCLPSFLLLVPDIFFFFLRCVFFIDYVYLLHTSSASISFHNFLIFLIDIFLVLSHSVVSNSLRYYGLQPLGSSFHGDFPGRHNGGGCHALLQRNFPTQGLKQDLPHCRWFLYQLSHQGSMYFLVIQ